MDRADTLIPPALRALLLAQYGQERTEEIGQGFCAERRTSFRVNRLRAAGDVAAELAAQGIASRRMEWYGDAYLTDGACEEALRATPQYAEGAIYLQSLSSMLPPLYLEPQAGESILDMTAAPGGKTTELCALSGGKALVTACERDKVRYERLKFNLERQGATRVTALCADALALDDAFAFDKILLDAPCTGSGTISPARPARFTESYLTRCTALQEKLLRKALRLLKRGGIAVYSTCSVLRQENEEVLERCLRGTPCELVPVEPPRGVPLLPAREGTVCVCPTREYEGFFLAKIRKG